MRTALVGWEEGEDDESQEEGVEPECERGDEVVERYVMQLVIDEEDEHDNAADGSCCHAVEVGKSEGCGPVGVGDVDSERR